MTAYAALIRGINVGGANVVSMQRLRTVAAACCGNDVRTYIQSGNLVFRAARRSQALETALERILARETGKPILVFVRSAAQMKGIIDDNPFGARGFDRAGLSVSFLKRPPRADALEALAAVKSGRDRFASRGKHLYLYCPDGYGRSKLAASQERLLRVPMTTRNWKTVMALYEMLKTNRRLRKT